MKLLLLDIETAPHRVYAWGLYDQDIAINQIEEPGYTLCWAAKWYNKRAIQFSSIRRDGKKQMLKLIHTLMSEADAIVHYNGNKFDVPTLNQECLAIGLTPPTPTHQIDLYQTAKRRFRFASNKLDYVAGELGLGHKTPHKGMELWRGCMAGNPDDWALMERYNKQDVRLLERVYTKMLPWIPNHPNHGNFANRADTCPNCGGHRLKSYGIRYAQTRAYQRLLCLDCGAWARSPVAEKRTRPDGSIIRPLVAL